MFQNYIEKFDWKYWIKTSFNWIALKLYQQWNLRNHWFSIKLSRWNNQKIEKWFWILWIEWKWKTIDEGAKKWEMREDNRKYNLGYNSFRIIKGKCHKIGWRSMQITRKTFLKSKVIIRFDCKRHEGNNKFTRLSSLEML